MSSYLNHYTTVPAKGRGGGFEAICTHSWDKFTQERLAWLYGPQHAAQRAAQTTADLAAWNRLGAGRSAA